VCVFSPSCSRFASSAIRSCGFTVGWLMTFDRLQRCHGYAGRYYPRVLPSGKLWDPIDANHIRRSPSDIRQPLIESTE
jgi:putative component of membrane protein insertase Oxa1/YidC/SpoIIIJ protein YidD